MRNAIQKMINRMLLLLTTFFYSVYAIAQEEGAKVNVDVTRTESTSTTWYSNPWVWIIGVAIFILLFAAIVRGNRTDA